MKRYLDSRHAVIDWVGLRGAMPAFRLDTGAPAILRPGDDETALRRVGWAEFFAAMEKNGLGLVVEDSPESTEHAFLDARRARREAPRHRRTVREFLRVPVLH